MRRFALIAVALLALVGTGCEEEEPDEPVIEAPPPPTPEEVAQQIRQTTGLNAPPPPAGAVMPPGAGQQFISAVQAAKTQHQATEEGKAALKMVSQDLDNRIKTFEQNEMWDFVIVGIDAYEILQGPGKYSRLRTEAEIELRKPRVTLKGIIDVNGTPTALMELYMPLSGQRITGERMALGERKHGIKFNRVIGNFRGAEFIYEETQDPFEAYPPTTRPE